MSLPADPFDGLSFDDGSYDRDKFYTKAYDSQGHATTIRTEVGSLKVTRAMAGMMGSVRERVPQYKTTQDQVRNYIVHGLKWDRDHIDGLSAEAKLEIDRYILGARLEAEQARRQDAQVMTEKIEFMFGECRYGKQDSLIVYNLLVEAIRTITYPDLARMLHRMRDMMEEDNPLLTQYSD